MPIDPKEADECFNYILQSHSIELILNWLEDRLDDKEIWSLDKAFKKWLWHNPNAFNLFMEEYLPVHRREVERVRRKIARIDNATKKRNAKL